MNQNTYFNVKLEFDHHKVDQIIHNTIISNGKGYVCSVEGNVLAVANSNPGFAKIVNDALVNLCDGNSIAESCISPINLLMIFSFVCELRWLRLPRQT